MTTLAAWLVTHDTLVVGCCVVAVAFLLYLPGLIVRLGADEGER